MSTSIKQLSATGRQAVQVFDWPKVNYCANKILEYSPENSEGHFLAGLYGKAISRPQKAISAFERALSLNPERYDAAIELANQYTIAQRNSEAAALLKLYKPLLKNSPRYLDLAGTIYSNIGFPYQAWPLFQNANALQPDIELFQSNLASSAVHLGKTTEAMDIYQNLLKKNPDHQRNHYHLSRLKKATDFNHIDQMKASLRKTNLSPKKNIFINYAIGKELEDLGEWDEAFSFYSKAGCAAAEMAKYNVDSDIKIINKIIETCNKT